MAMSYVKVWFDFEDRTEMLNEVEKGRLLLAMLRYAQGKELPELKGAERFLFPVFKMDIDRDATTYSAKVANGAKGGRPRKETEENQEKPNKTEHNLNAKTKEQKTKELRTEEQKTEEHIGSVQRKRFTPPTTEQVSDYCREKGYPIDAARFVDYYTSKGWKVGQTPMKDWQAALRNWAKRASEGSTSANPAMQFTQRDYGSTDLNALILGKGVG